MALSCDSQPHFTTIADFIAKFPRKIETIFADVLVLCDSMGLIGRQLFAIGGCKISPNASKEWSGTRKTFEKKKAKMEREVCRILKKKRRQGWAHALKQGSETFVNDNPALEKEADLMGKRAATGERAHPDLTPNCSERNEIADIDEKYLISEDGNIAFPLCIRMFFLKYV